MSQHNVLSLPGAFPLHQDKRYISESEWVIWKLLCRPLSSLPENTAEELYHITGSQISVQRCGELIRITNIATLTGIGTWIARLLAECDFDVNEVCDKPAEVLLESINKRLGYALCNQASIRAFEALQLQWRGEEEKAKQTAKQAEQKKP
ncbi:MAG: hypothetical protein Q9M19_03945 [Mariprofundaceae bacterium]|nr:hypothetical protein [Mariprofundaceae bacterium]